MEVSIILKIEAGEMYGFKIVNIFPDKCTDEEWTEFADNMLKIINNKDVENKASA